MKKVLIFIVLFCSINLLNTQDENRLKLKTPSLQDIIKQDIRDTKEGLNQIKNLLKNFSKYIKKSSYLESSRILIEKEDEGKIIFNFGYKGHGDLNKPYEGFATKIDFKKVPSWLQEILKQNLSSLGFERLINVNPKDEFFIKFVLLVLDKKNNKINLHRFFAELIFIFYRLALIKDFQGMDIFLKNLSGPFADLIGDIKVKNKKLSAFLNEYWEHFKFIVNYDFAVEDKLSFEITKEDLIESNDWRKISKISFAIGLRTVIDYYKAREEFIKTSEGKKLLEKINSAPNKKEKFARILEFNKSMDEYKRIVRETRNRIIGFLRRIKGIRKFWNKVIDKIRPNLEPFFEEVGIPFELIFPKLDELEDINNIEELYKEEDIIFESNFENDPFSSDFEFSDF
ncbi:hypothetical protein GF385_02085 [Candidatus Dependentiae bacterium]|nr:hypothetical protein [Candidatus Dependentiae bacterium]